MFTCSFTKMLVVEDLSLAKKTGLSFSRLWILPTSFPSRVLPLIQMSIQRLRVNYDKLPQFALAAGSVLSDWSECHKTLESIQWRQFKFFLWEHTGQFMGAYGGLMVVYGGICHNAQIYMWRYFEGEFCKNFSLWQARFMTDLTHWILPLAKGEFASLWEHSEE